MAKSRPAADIIVAGGGPAGLSAALALATAGLDVVVIDPLDDPRRDRRTSALMAGSVAMLRRLGAWPECAPAAAPLERLRIIDDTGRLLRAPTVEFAAEEVGEPAFGWNVPNQVLLAALRRRIAETANAELVAATVELVELSAEAAHVHLADGRRIAGLLIVAADGRRSICRSAAGIALDEWSYDQAAIVLNFGHELPHGNVSTEFHTREGPFTLVPLPGRRSSLVWVRSRRAAAALSVLDTEALAREIEAHSHRLLGTVTVEEPRGVYPLSGLVARRYGQRRVVLVGEASHVLPPIGAQGLNLGLRDAAMVAETIGDAALAGEDPGSDKACGLYDRARRIDVLSRTGAIDVLNRSLLTEFLPVQALRAAGLTALGAVGPLRRFVMREGIRPGYRLPRLMRAD